MDNDGIPFFCTFDYLGKGLLVYTFKTTCCEDTAIALEDGITKIIINSKAVTQEKNAKLKVFLEYMNGKVSGLSACRYLQDCRTIERRGGSAKVIGNAIIKRGGSGGSLPPIILNRSKI